MNELNMDLKLEPVLANICQQLADFFGTTTEKVIDNAPEFLAKYGWFSVLSDIGENVFFCGLCLFLISGLMVFLISVINDEILYDKVDKQLNPIKCAVIFFISGMVLNIVFLILPCLIAPELVGLQHLLKLFNIGI